MDRGHVFVTLGDITHLECDAWLLPTDRAVSVEPGWRKAVPRLDERLGRTDKTALREGSASSVALWRENDSDPWPFLATVPYDGIRDDSGVEHILRSTRAFVALAAAEIPSARHNRSKRLFAIPNFGTAGGGGAQLRGRLAEALLDECLALARQFDVDLAIVLRSERSFARMQALRKARSGWHALPPEHEADAARLARDAASDRLVPFIGAGASMSAGGPSWDELLDSLADGLGLDAAQRKQLSAWGALDRASYLRERAVERAIEAGGSAEEGARTFAQKIADMVERPRYGLTPALLASLKPAQAITLNYDTLFERASSDAGAPRTLIPGDGDGVEGRWLLKLHGSVEDLDSIVLTRDDYLGYAAQREALSAIVKANLLTHHLLFVGFGLNDEHFHRIVHDVRRALPPGTDMAGRATAVTLSADPVAATLWKGQVRMRPVSEEGAGDGRQVEIFLDVLVALTTDAHSYLLDEEFESSLTPDERALKGALGVLQRSLSDLPSRTAGHAEVARLLRELGAEL